MADELKRVGLVFKADGAVDFQKSLQEVNASVQENRSAFKLAQSQWDENTKSIDKLKDRQKYLADQTKDYSDKVKILERQLEELEGAEERNEKAIQSKKDQLNKAKTSLNNYKKGLKDVEDKLKDGSAAADDFRKKLDGFADGAKNAGEKMGGISTAAAGILGAVVATVPATEEYRKIMGSLEVSSEKAGYSAEQTKESYQRLYGVLGDDQTAATTTANLQALGLSQEELTELINGTIGAWSTYGDSIPIDGLAEAINETIKVGQVTGNFADMLNWAGTNEDEFNEKLAQCKTEAERVDLVMQEMANQGLAQAGEKWQENNKNLVDGNKASADLQNSMAELADLIAPIVTDITTVVADLLDKFTSLSPETQMIILGVVALVAVLAPLISGIGSLALGISGMIPMFTALWGIMQANPIGVIIIVVGLLVAAFLWLWENCDGFRQFWIDLWEKVSTKTKETVEKVKQFISNMKDNMVKKVTEMKENATNKFNEIKNGIQEKIQGAKQFVVDGFNNMKDSAVEKVTAITSSVKSKFDEIKNGIRDKINGAKDFVKSGIDKMKSFFNFTWSLPKLKMPHFSLKGKFSLSPPSVPKLSVSWYAKGGILNRPTIFGRRGDNLLGGGEAGKEAVLPIHLLKDYIREENRANNGLLVSAFREALAELNMVADNHIYIGDRKVADVLTEMVTKKITSKNSQFKLAHGR